VGERVPLGGGVGAGLRESDTDLRDQLDATLTEMKADGSLNAMLAKWFPGEEVPTYTADKGAADEGAAEAETN
jgi:polar amino acid transport system substrate-binding protein